MKWSEMSAYTFQEKEKDIAILPIGAIEAHGPHLPIGTDNILAERVAELLGDKTNALILPVLPLGQVWSLKDFPGSLTISNSTLISIITELGESIYKQGFKKFVIINAHLGNQTALKEASRKLLDLVPQLKTFTFFYPDIKEIAKDVCETTGMHDTYFHADEIETSIMLYLAEEKVDMDKAIKDIPTIPDSIDFTPIPWSSFTKSAVLGDATKATKEKGRTIVEHAVKRMVSMINGEKRNVDGSS
ncbi:creatininase family protein [Evansella halocellulosilytica]|uniref:creatininase family protein n=1 Tax=Evansella halocellulosilytica TaxID=2011013 RepID=UPI000BB80398|nr:creatininase family protein [Evansella halocellulosilytica]